MRSFSLRVDWAMGWNPGKSFSIARSGSLSTLAPRSLYCLLSVFCQITDASEEEKLSRPFLSWCYDPSGHVVIVLRPHSRLVASSRARGGFSWNFVLSLPFCLLRHFIVVSPVSFDTQSRILGKKQDVLNRNNACICRVILGGWHFFGGWRFF